MDERSYFENIASYKLLAKKEVGQNFLVDPIAAKSIVDALDIKPNENVLEIGCGAGSLTFFLSQSEGNITAIDIDEAMLLKSGNDFNHLPNVNVTYGNATKYDYAPYDKIVGNLPYYITTLILERVLLTAKNCRKMVFMVQKEAGERIASKPGTKDYSPLSVLLGLGFDIKRIRTVGRNSFVPIPHVESAVYEITPKKVIASKEAEDIYLLAKALFLQRRKTLRNNLKAYLGDESKADEALTKCHIAPTSRPEDLSPSDYYQLYLALTH